MIIYPKNFGDILFRLLFISALLLNLLYSKNFTVMSYNVENLFDLKNDKTEYFEYKINNRQTGIKKTFL